ncbi:hypothetical protein BH688_03105 [Kushneria phosphatilytica]|nr:hypothetical protein BH688_03105 [Kushneria phosphatilytica]
MVTGEFETDEQHGRELVRKGFALQADGHEVPPHNPISNEPQALEDLRARAAELGISNVGRMKEETLRERIAEAEKAAAEQTEGEGEDGSEDGDGDTETTDDSQ